MQQIDLKQLHFLQKNLHNRSTENGTTRECQPGQCEYKLVLVFHDKLLSKVRTQA
jgi:aerobic-type carbon monoxide dehydrogenase small subunit (CoxS/CutS family)